MIKNLNEDFFIASYMKSNPKLNVALIPTINIIARNNPTTKKSDFFY